MPTHSEALPGRMLERVTLLAERVDWMAFAAFMLPFTLYVLTLAPTIYNLDSAELTTAAATGGIVRATGYPFYLVLGNLWSRLPVGDVGYRLNLSSAAYSALALLFAELSMRRLHVGKWARFCAWGFLAIAPYFWALSLIAEVYTLHVTMMAAVTLALLRWKERPTPARLFLPVLLMTLSMGNHAATVLLVPGSLFFVLVSHPRVLVQPRSLLAAVAGLVLGAMVFLYLPLAYGGDPAFNYAGEYNAAGEFEAVNLQTPAGIVWLITGRTFAGQMFGYGLAEMPRQFAGYGEQLLTAFAAIGIGPGIVGALALLRRDWRTGMLLLLFFLGNLIFFANYRVVDKNTMFLPTYYVFALWVGIGFQAIVDIVDGMPERRTGEGPVWRNWLTAGTLIRGLVLAVLLVVLPWNWQRVDLSHDYSTREQSEEILSEVEPGALIFGWWETVPGIQYLQFVEGQRPDVQAINRFLISGDDMETLIRNSVSERPVYINSPSLTLIQTMEVQQVGHLYQVLARK
jgi:hypothetical protein